MSKVTDVILTASLMEEMDDSGTSPAANRLSAWLEEKHRSPLVRVDGSAGGFKVMQALVFLSAVNYLDEDGFIEAVRSAGWEDPQSVRVLFNREGSEGFELVLNGLPAHSSLPDQT